MSAIYHSRADRFADEAARQARTANALSTARIIAFIAAIALFVWAETASYRGVPVVLGGLALAAFLVLVVAHGRVRDRLARNEALRDVNLDAIRRLDRDWQALPHVEARVDAIHPYAHDLDVVGRASLFRLLAYNATPPGRAKLLRWLIEAAPADTVMARQRAAAELADAIDLRDDMAARARLMGAPRAGATQRFLEWAEAAPWLSARPQLLAAARLVPIVTLTLLALRLLGVTDADYWIAPFLFHVWAVFAFDARIRETHARAFPGPDVFEHYGALFAAIAAARFEAPRLRALQDALTVDGLDAAHQLARLGRLMDLASVRGSMLHFPIHALTLYDLHVIALLERWQTRIGPRVRAWFDALGEVDALAALGGLAHAHPEWSWPRVETGGTAVFARGLGHPLLRADRRVDNDVRVGPAGSFLLVTGSNMSGKSTLLRALGLNVVLAQAGGPVAAEELSLPPVRVLTSMRVSDSLEEGVSYFMAELRRLKSVIDAADALAADPDWTALYLLDEILGGTNTAERQVAVRRVVRHLIDVGAIGAVTTHDLALAELPELEASAVPVHFREDVGAGTMTFDYRLHPGVATSVNALKLMELMGLGLVEREH